MKIFTGRVISKKMDKTATVLVEKIVAHPIYKKRYKRFKKYHIHDEFNVAEVGQLVKFVASKPVSKFKKWNILKNIGSKETKKNIDKPKKERFKK